MGPLELLYSWQALIVAVTATGFTQLVKTILDVVWGHRDQYPTPTYSDAKARGEELRRRSLVVNRFVLPMVPILAGFIFAMVVPLYPEVLHTYVDEHVPAWWQKLLVYGSWGAACGQFADYGVSKVKAALGGSSPTPPRAPGGTVAPAAAPEPADPGPTER